MTRDETSEAAQLIRGITGLGLIHARKAIEIAIEHCGGDLLHGAGYVVASSYAVNVRNDRHGWNLRRGSEYADRFRSDGQHAAVVERLDELRRTGPRP